MSLRTGGIQGVRAEGIIRQALAPNQQIQHTIGRGHVNGLLFVSTNYDMSRIQITVKRRPNAGMTRVLCANHELRDLAFISDYEGGFSMQSTDVFSRLYGQLAPAAFTSGTGASNYAAMQLSDGEQKLSMFYVELGSMYLGKNSELDITINTTAGLVGTGILAVYRISKDKLPDQMVQYDRVLDFEATHTDVEKIFYRSASSLVVDDATLAVTTEDAATFQIEDGMDSYLLDWLGAVGITNAFGEYEGPGAAAFLTQIYGAPDVLPAEVFCKVSGVVGSSSCYLIVKKRVYDAGAVSENTERETRKTVERIATLERKDPATAQALRHAAGLPKANELAAAVEEKTG